MPFLQNGATGIGGTAAYKKGNEGLWFDECDVAGVGLRDLPPCGDDNNFGGIVPVSAQGVFTE